MKYLIFAELNRNHFLFLTYFIISFIKAIFNRYIKTTEDIVESFHVYYIYTLSDFLSIIPVIIIKMRSKSLTMNKLEKENLILENKKYVSDLSNIIKNKNINDNIKNNKKRTKRIIKLTILVSIFDFLSLYLKVTFYIIVQNSNYVIKAEKIHSMILFNILSKYVLSIIILHLAIYKHHYLSLALNCLFLIGLVIYDIISISEARTYLYVLMKIVVVILYSFEDVYAKILLSIDSVSPYIYLLYRGICVNILSLLYSLVFVFVKIPDENGQKSIVFTRFWKLFENKLKILLYILLLFVEYFWNLNIISIIDKFSPIHFAVASILENIGSLLISIIFVEIDIKEFFIKLALYILLILAALLYNEFIILNFCGLQKNTQLFLQKKANKDIQQAIINNIDHCSIDDDEKSASDMINIGNTNYGINKLDLIENKDKDLDSIE